MAAPRLRRVQSRKEMETVRDDFITQGYEVLREGEGTTLMRKSTWGSTGTHVIIALLTVWWTIGLANIIYALVAHNGADQVMLKLEAPDSIQPASPAEVAVQPASPAEPVA